MSKISLILAINPDFRNVSEKGETFKIVICQLHIADIFYAKYRTQINDNIFLYFNFVYYIGRISN